MKKKIIGLGLVSLLILTLATPVMASRPYRPLAPNGLLLDRVASRLDLSEVQREEVQSILQEHRFDVIRILKSMKERRQDLFDAVHTHPPSEADIRQQSEEVAEVMADLAVLRSQIADEVYSVLTSDQQEEAEAMRQDLRIWVESLVDTLRTLLINP